MCRQERQRPVTPVELERRLNERVRILVQQLSSKVQVVMLLIVRHFPDNQRRQSVGQTGFRLQAKRPAPRHYERTIRKVIDLPGTSCRR